MEVLYSEAEITRRIAEMGREIARFYAGKPLTLIVLMNGGAFFGADLARAIDLPLRFDSMRAASYVADARGAVLARCAVLCGGTVADGRPTVGAVVWPGSKSPPGRMPDGWTHRPWPVSY